MRAATWLILFCVLRMVSFAQVNTIKSTDVYVEQVNKYKKENVYIKKSFGDKSQGSSLLTAYYLKTKLQLITTRLGDDFSYVEYSYYIEKDSLLFVNERKVSLKEPVTEKEYADYEKYVIFNTDKNGNTDLTKWPLTVDISNNYYFTSRKIVRYELKNFNKPVKPLENELEEVTKELITRYTTHLAELK